MSDLDDLARQYIAACLAGDKRIGERARLEAELDQAQDTINARLNAPQALGRAAAWYARQGIAIFPLLARDKRPALPRAHPDDATLQRECQGKCGRLGHGLYDATTDLDQIRAWWTAHPDYNIGARTGITFDVVDVDGTDGVIAAMATPGQEWRDGLIGHATTSRPGGHHLFYKPTGAGNSAGILPAVDYRGASGYVVLPPSVGANGRRYAWLTPLTLAAP